MFAFGRKLAFPFRLFFTLIIFYLRVDMCFIGRTMETGWGGYTLGMALIYFAMFCGLPALSFLCIWHGKASVILTLMILPVCLTAACAIATLEEWMFIQKYREAGTEPRSRWIRHHWLAYDADKQLLYGSD